MLFTLSFQHKHTWVRGEDFKLLSCKCSSKLMLQLQSVCKLKRINGLYYRYKNIKAHSCTNNLDPVAKLWLKTGAHTKYALISPYIWFREEKMGFVFIVRFFYPREFFYLKADNLILGFAINSQIFGRVTLFEDNHAFRWSDVRRVVENIFYGMYQFSLFQI